MSGSRRLSACALLLSLLALPRVGWAQEAAAPAAEHAAAQDAHRRALDLFDRGQYAEALTEFERAYNLAPSFRIQYNIGLSQVALGDPAAAVEAFGIYLKEGGDRIPEPRRKQVEAEVTRLSKQLASLTLDVDERGSDVTLDGAPLAQGPLSRQLRLNQGKHTVSVRSADGTLKTQTVQLAGGQEQRLHFEARNESAAAPRPVVAASGAPAQPEARPARTLTYVAWGVTGVLGASAAITGVLALNAHADEHDAQLRQGVSPGELSAARDKVSNLALATDVLLVGTAVAAGVSLYLTLKPSSQRETTTALVLGPGSLRLHGSF